GPEKAWERICELKLVAPIGSAFKYSDVNFIVLGKIVEHISGKRLKEYTQDEIFTPLEMKQTGFLPATELQSKCAPTEQREGHWMQGEVHDPRAYALGGIAGHAGLFSTADNIAIYSQMMLHEGVRNVAKGVVPARILSPVTVATMTRAYTVPGGLRGLGWDSRTAFSSNRGDLLSPSAFGHGGFTGNVLWIDPELDLFFVFLSNRVHPNGKGSVNQLAGKIANVVATSVTKSDSVEKHSPRSVLTGLDVLEANSFRELAGQRVGLITNHTGRNHAGQSAVNLFKNAANVKLKALFSPEHGFEGKLDIAKVSDSEDKATGVKIFSLYGETRRPTAEMLADIDTVVFDIQDIGTRFYTYISTMGEAMIAAAEHHRRFVVLDRPNPINGIDVVGPMLDPNSESFVGFHRLPVRHGMTIGELARMFKQELKLELDLQVIACEGWQRSDYWDKTGLTWVNPSPNMRSLTEALLYPGVGLIETTNVSVGRGTDTPFEVVGAPWIDGRKLAKQLNERQLPGVTFVPIEFTPTSTKFTNEACK
ncbi:MAG TPA: exo-beta-N-acetylmuramidase NamZ domain-containing protein, partial [Pirellula sp.]|nr:exo-beta-N-acetylmuramidase NamZ domain-containing protein [Pirellula sp.]